MSRVIKSLYTGPRKVLDRLAEVLEACDDLVEQIDTVGLVVDDIKQTLGDLVQQKPELNALLQPVKGKGRRKKEDTSLPVKYASSVEIKWGPDSAVVTIDGQSLILSLKLGMLLEILLAEDNYPSANPRDGWKAREELALRLGKQTGGLATKHSLENLLYRLKKEFRLQAGLEGLVQCDPRLGIRIALQKNAAEPVHYLFKSIEKAQ